MGASLNRNRSKQDYQTPPEFLTAVRDRLKINEFGFDLAASEESKVCEAFFSEEQDSLAEHNDWDNTLGWNWLNPPYNDITPWVKKASEQSLDGNLIAMLVPASVGANWWLNHVINESYQLFLNGRITFVGAKDPYPKDCALLLYTPFIRSGSVIWSWREK